MDFKIVENRQLRTDIFLMSVKHLGKMKPAVPGQFVHVKCSPSYDPLLRRPFSIFKMDGETLSILYKIAGRGTKMLSGKMPGESADIIGPLGKGFDIRPDAHPAVIVSGGMGIAPTFYLASVLGKKVKKFLIGCRTLDFIVCESEIKRMGVEVETCTDDGSCGTRGSVCCLLEKFLSDNPASPVYACGPEEMLKKTAELCGKFKIPCQLSLERRMACGVGACMGCVIRVKDRGKILYKRVCRDGPVFSGESVAW